MTETARHTPGPWEWMEQAGDLALYGGQFPRHRLVTEADSALPEAARAANRAILKAAPDLLAACEAVACAPIMERGTTLIDDALREQLRAAIAIAKGETI